MGDASRASYMFLVAFYNKRWERLQAHTAGKGVASIPRDRYLLAISD